MSSNTYHEKCFNYPKTIPRSCVEAEKNVHLIYIVFIISKYIILFYPKFLFNTNNKTKQINKNMLMIYWLII